MGPNRIFQVSLDVVTPNCHSATLQWIFVSLGQRNTRRGVNKPFQNEPCNSQNLYCFRIATPALVCKNLSYSMQKNPQELYNRQYTAFCFSFDPDPRERVTFWSIVVMMSILWMCMTVAQPAVQRYCSLPSLTKAKV